MTIVSHIKKGGNWEGCFARGGHQCWTVPTKENIMSKSIPWVLICSWITTQTWPMTE